MNRCKTGINDLRTWCIKNKRPDILNEWDYESNGGLTPSNVSAKSSSTKVHWKCAKGHKWVTSVSNRTRDNHKCPYCCNQRVLKGYNDLATTHPRLLADWDYSKNKIKPTEIIAGTHKKAHWKCHKCGNEWESEIKSRSLYGIGCPYCSGKKPIVGKTDIASVYPQVLKDWDYSKNKFKPTEITYGSGKNIWWKCKYGHSYQMTIHNKINSKVCPKCFKWRRTSFPEQALLFYIRKSYPDAINHYREIFRHGMELDIYIPSVKVGIEYDGLAWHTDKHLERERRKYAICKKEGISLIRLMENKERRNLGICDNAFWVAKPHNNYYLTRAIRDILYILGDVKFELPRLEQPRQINIYGTNTIEDIIKIEATPIHFHDFENFINTDVDVERDKDEICSFIDKGTFSLEDKFPEIAKEWDYKKNGKLTPRMIHYGANSKHWWICSVCGTSWKTSVAERTGHDHTGCPQCAKQRGGRRRVETLVKRGGSLADTYPQLVKEWDYQKNKYKPTEITASSGYRAHWICKKCGAHWCTAVHHRTVRHSGCPVCKNFKIVSGINDLATKRPDLLKDWDYSKNKLDPTKIGAGSSKRVFWKCHKCGHEWSTIISSRGGKRNSGCPHCFDLTKFGNKYSVKKR